MGPSARYFASIDLGPVEVKTKSSSIKSHGMRVRAAAALLDSREIQIDRKLSLAADKHRS